jgi:elongation factor 1 alpha-like protein
VQELKGFIKMENISLNDAQLESFAREAEGDVDYAIDLVFKFVENAKKVAQSQKKAKEKEEKKKQSLPKEKSGQSAPAAVKVSQKDLNKSAKDKQELLELVISKRSSKLEKSVVNLVVCGHVDAGKSTLMGHLLFLKGLVESKTMRKYEKESSEMGKSSFKFAWVLDSNESERNRGVTVDVAVRHFETENRHVVLLDAPGHKDFVPNMISGASQADYGILVVDSSNGEFERGFQDKGQCKEHAILLKSCGISKIIVVVNKLDNVDWSEPRFNLVVELLFEYLKTLGYNETDLQFIPCSGLTGENILTRSVPALSGWYSGKTLVEVIDSLEVMPRQYKAPVRVSITDVFKPLQSGSEITVGGKVECGALICGEPVLILPQRHSAVVKSIQYGSGKLALAGDNVEIGLNGLGEFVDIVSPGQVICEYNSPIKVSSRIQARIVLMNLDIPLLNGAELVLHANGVDVECHISKLEAKLDRVNESVIRKNPRCLGAHSSGIVELKLNRAICVEEFAVRPEFGRITLRRQGFTIAAGIVVQVYAENI